MELSQEYYTTSTSSGIYKVKYYKKVKIGRTDFSRQELIILNI